MLVNSVAISRNGPMVSELVAGFWRLRHWGMSPQETLNFIEQLLELGITTVDHAMVYRSEEPFGQALALKPSLRSQLQIVSKCGIRPCGFGELGAQVTNHFDSSAKAILQSVDASLSALGTDYLDILLLHRPDYLMQVDEVVEAFSTLKQQGKVQHFGVSNFSRYQFELLQSAWSGQLVTNQVEFSPYAIEPLDHGVFEQCQLAGVRPMLWSCLAGGRLMAPTDERGKRIVQALHAVREQISADAIEQVVYAWVRMLPCQPLAMLGSSNIDRVKMAAAACKLSLTREQWYAIWEASNGAPVP